MKKAIERFRSRGQHLCKFIGTKESFLHKKTFNSRRTGLGHQHGHRFIALEQQHSHQFIVLEHHMAAVSLCWDQGLYKELQSFFDSFSTTFQGLHSIFKVFLPGG